MDPRDSIIDAGVVAAFFEKAVIPRDTVNYQQPGYWDRPLVNNDIVDVVSGIGWVPVLVQESPEDPYSLLVQSYTLTTAEALPAAGVEFRIRTDNGLLAHTQFGEGIERHRDTTYPLRRQRLFHPVTINDTLILECRNTTGAAVRVLAALQGWFLWDPESSSELSNRREGVVDV